MVNAKLLTYDTNLVVDFFFVLDEMQFILICTIFVSWYRKYQYPFRYLHFSKNKDGLGFWNII